MFQLLFLPVLKDWNLSLSLIPEGWFGGFYSAVITNLKKSNTLTLGEGKVKLSGVFDQLKIMHNIMTAKPRES